MTGKSEHPELTIMAVDGIRWLAPVGPDRIAIGLYTLARHGAGEVELQLSVPAKVARQLGGLLEMLAPVERLADSEPPMDSAQPRTSGPPAT